MSAKLKNMALDNYKDITSYSQKEKERNPRILKNDTIPEMMFKVHKHLHYDNEWLLSCDSIGISCHRLGTEDMEKAKERAIWVMIRLLEEKAKKYHDAALALYWEEK